MQKQIKIIVGIGLIVVALGAWYYNSGTDEQKEQQAEKESREIVRDSRPDEKTPGEREMAPVPEEDADISTDQGEPASEQRELELPPLAEPDTAEEPAKPADQQTTEPEQEAFMASEQDQDQEPIEEYGPEGIGPTDLAEREVEQTEEDGDRAAPAAATRPAESLRLPSTNEAGSTTQPSMTAEAGETTAEPAKKKEYKTHVVQRGDTLSALAARYLGNARYAGKIIKANPGIQPRRLQVGMELKIPTDVEQTDATQPSTIEAGEDVKIVRGSASPVPQERAYTVKAGEGWYDLAKRFLGDGSRWPELYEMNKDRVPRNPNILPEGTVIELPENLSANES
jgi:nucleoid-associated protein YgaU